MLPTQSPSAVIGRITIYPKIILGEGGNSKVRVGSLDGRPVAVKRVPYNKKDPESELNEIDMLLKCDGHENVVKYYTKEIYKNEFIYIALELCDGNLDDWIKQPSPTAKHISKAGILEQTSKGVEYLHRLGIIHRDLKPQNILLSTLPGSNNVRVKITDFGISQKLDQGQIAKTIQTGAGTIGWMAPEILQYHLKNPRATDSDKLKMTRQTDIFQLGCVFYFVLSNGKHPFGTNFIMQFNNINQGTPTLNLADMEYEHVGSARLIQLMLANDPSTRPSASVVLSHHLFWSKADTLNFLTDVSNVTDNRPNMSNDIENCVKNMEQHYSRKSFTNWVNRTGPEVQHWIRNNDYRAYKNNDVMDLVRAIRNMKGHFFDSLPFGTKQEVGNSLDGMMSYWLKRFPFIVDMIWLSFHTLRNKPEYNLGNYYWKAGNYQFREFSKAEKDKFDDFMEREYEREFVTRNLEEFNFQVKPGSETKVEQGDQPCASGQGERGRFIKGRGRQQPHVPKWVNKGERDDDFAGGKKDEEYGSGERGKMRKAKSYGDITVENGDGDEEEGAGFNDDHAKAFRGRGRGNGWRGGERGGRRARGFRGRQGNNYRGRGRGNGEFMGGNKIWVRLDGPLVMGAGNGGNRGSYHGRGWNEWGAAGAGRGFNNGRRGAQAGYHGRGNYNGGGGGRGFPQWE